MQGVLGNEGFEAESKAVKEHLEEILAGDDDTEAGKKTK